MTAKDAVELIIKTPKYYMFSSPPMKQSTASRIVIAIKDGTCKPDTEKEFLRSHGYDIVQERQYIYAV